MWVVHCNGQFCGAKEKKNKSENEKNIIKATIDEHEVYCLHVMFLSVNNSVLLKYLSYPFNWTNCIKHDWHLSDCIKEIYYVKGNKAETRERK